MQDLITLTNEEKAKVYDMYIATRKLFILLIYMNVEIKTDLRYVYKYSNDYLIRNIHAYRGLR